MSRVGKKQASWEVGNLSFLFFLPNFIFYKLECTGGKRKKKIENKKKKKFSMPFLAHPAGGQETTFYLRWPYCFLEHMSIGDCKSYIPGLLEIRT